jgi:23S rRNA pseudouridine1911/1915/1917 synthase
LTPADDPPGRWLEYRAEPADDGLFVRDLLARRLGLSRSMVRRAWVAGSVLLDGARPYLTTRVRVGATLRVRVSDATAGALRPVHIPLGIVYEDDDVLVVDKPAGLLVHPSVAGQVRTLAHGVAFHDLARGGAGSVHPVHRLDRDTSGLVLFARHAHAHRRLDASLRAGDVARGYTAIVDGHPPGRSGWIDAPIARADHDPHLRRVAGHGDPARTRWTLVERLPAASLLDVALDTGRTHQIRVHLAALGNPLVGDVAYGGAGDHPRQALHAGSLRFPHPIDRTEIAVSAPLPADLTALLLRLRERAPRLEP